MKSVPLLILYYRKGGKYQTDNYTKLIKITVSCKGIQRTVREETTRPGVENIRDVFSLT